MKSSTVRLSAVRVMLGLMAVMFALCALGGGAVAQTSPPAGDLIVKGDIPAEVHFSAEDLDKLPQESATIPEEDGATSKYDGVSLRSILEKSGAPVGRALRGKSLASYILAKARDGYEVVFTIPEVDENFANEPILVAYKRNGKPLFAYQGPFRLVCPKDKAGARSVRMLESLELIRLRK